MQSAAGLAGQQLDQRRINLFLSLIFSKPECGKPGMEEIPASVSA
jgi:hypothetical protein